MVQLANGLIEADLSVEMYALFQLEHFFKIDSLVQFSEAPNPPYQYKLFTRVMALLSNIRRVARNSGASTIIVYGRFYSALTLLATAGLKKRVFISDRASPLYRDEWHVNAITHLVFCLIKPAGVIAQTKESAAYQRELFGRNVPIEVIPNPVKINQTVLSPKENIVLAVGRFGDKLKGFDRLIEAWGKVKSSGWQLVFAGGVESEDVSLGKRAKELGVYESVLFLGKVHNMDEWYAKSSIFVIPSRSEGFPNALVEAMCAGIACISFDFVAGPRDIIQNKVNGIIVPNGDIDELASAIEELIHNPELRAHYAHNATSIKTIFNAKIIINKIIQFIST